MVEPLKGMLRLTQVVHLHIIVVVVEVVVIVVVVAGVEAKRRELSGAFEVERHLVGGTKIGSVRAPGGGAHLTFACRGSDYCVPPVGIGSVEYIQVLCPSAHTWRWHRRPVSGITLTSSCTSQ
jgi:hypothetical protein